MSQPTEPRTTRPTDQRPTLSRRHALGGVAGVGLGLPLLEGVVVTQPTEGEFLGFSITCTHQGCPVDSVSDAGISCPCHGSIFDLSSGAPTAGPATSALGSVSLTVDGDEISRA